MFTGLAEAQGIWWRFDRYELVKGVIQPAEGAAFSRYNPWTEPLEDSDDDGAGMTDGLLNIAEAVAPHRTCWARGPGALPLDIGQKVLDWCGRFGLLGLWHHQLVAAFLPPRTTRNMQERVVRIRAGRAASSGFAAEKPPAGDRGAALWCMLPRSFRDSSRMQWTPVADPPRAKLRGLWASFFPRTPGSDLARRGYNFALQEGFWRGYGEPLEAFLSAAVLWRDFAYWEAWCNRRDEEDWAMAQESVHALLGGLYPALGLSKKQSVLKWRSNSLLGALSGMVVLQREDEHKRIVPCVECGKWTVSSQPNRRYCSNTCRRRANTRANRANRKLRG
ncbi:MAG TPA: hypothetical protein VM285_16545 [Polyangia bacterium]|nr:hypothetical protein [Polyangia bacterium]